MAAAPRIRVRRGTRSQITAAAAANGLLAGEPMLVTDEGRPAMATADNAVVSMVGSTAVHEIVEITQAAYDALGTPDPNTLYLITDGSGGAPVAWADITGKPDPEPVLGLMDWWAETVFGNSNAAASDFFAGAAISSGTNNTAIPTGAMTGKMPFGVFLRSSTTANGGYRYQTSQAVGMYFGTQAQKFRAVITPRTSMANTMYRIGWHDSVTSADATDGVYFEVNAGTITAKTANNSTRTANATTAAMVADRRYILEIDVNAAGNSARFRVWEDDNETPILDVTNTANIPTTSARSCGAGLVATESTTTANDLCILWYMGCGTPAAYQRRTGRT